ncbi:MAG: sugar nucleotide-binding protein [Rhodanobacteraceae bacterium]|nr:sugar nucleotide-binding protein [Rhodanobacteraceae bacterium]
MRAQRVLIAGCGELGISTAACLPDATVFGLRRNPASLPPGIQPVAADLLTGEGFSDLPEAIDTVLYAPTPSVRSEEGYRAIYVHALERLLHALPQPAGSLRLVYVSSTAVYGQDGGEWVDEGSTTAPAGFNGRVLLEGERLAASLVRDTSVLRLSGLYGPGRHWLLRRVRAGEALLPGEHWTNRIHLDDAAALAALLVRAASVPPRVIGVDDTPATEREVLDWIAQRLGLPPLPEQFGGALIGGKRLCNRLARSLGWQPRYPSYRDGYTSVLPGSAHP